MNRTTVVRPILSILSAVCAMGSAALAQVVYAPGATVGSSPNGNVGVGTAIPLARLTIVGAGSAQNDSGIVQITSGTGANTDHKLTFGVSDSGYSWIQAIKPGDNYKTLSLNPTGGNVGVGTSNPLQRLSIVGGNLNVGAEGDYYGAWLSGGQSTDSYLGLGEWYSRAGYIKWVNSARRLAIYTTDSSEPVSLQENGGNVGIGTTNPTHTLSVNGTGKFKEVIVETTGWSDYVFAPDYELQSLREVEAHIKEHQHLPGIPSAEEIAEQGVSVGEMQAKLLAKIEELTLHQIALEKQVTAQAAEIAELRARRERPDLE